MLHKHFNAKQEKEVRAGSLIDINSLQLVNLRLVTAFYSCYFNDSKTKV